MWFVSLVFLCGLVLLKWFVWDIVGLVVVVGLLLGLCGCCVVLVFLIVVDVEVIVSCVCFDVDEVVLMSVLLKLVVLFFVFVLNCLSVVVFDFFSCYLDLESGFCLVGE